MAVLFAKPRSSHETVNDLHGDLVNLARVVADDELAPRLYDRLQRTLMAEPIILDAKATVSTPYEDDRPDIDRAYHYFVISWAGRNGVSGTKRHNYQMAVRWTSGGGSGAVRFRSAIESLPWWHARLQSVEILRRDLFVLLDKIEDEVGTAIYLDPPYFHRGSRTGSNDYLHEFTATDHERLAAAAARFAVSRVVVSYYHDPALDELYPSPHWTKRHVHTNKNLHVQNRRGAKKTVAPEVLLINGESYQPSNDGLFTGETSHATETTDA